MITAEYIYTEQEAIRAAVEVSKCAVPSLLVRLLMPLIVRHEARKRFRLNPSANKKVTWRFDDQNVENATDGATGVYAWRVLLNIKEVHDGFLIFPQPRLAHWVPKKAFLSEVEISTFRDLVRKSGVKYDP
jgi:hypothetical protein